MEGRPPCAGRSKGRGKGNHHKRRNETMRKRILSTLLALCLALSLLPASALAAGGEQKSYVALGDSITTGYGLTENETGFAKQVADSNGYTLTNLAQDGATSTDLLEVVKSEANADTLKNADLITVTIGGNDLMDALYAYLAKEYNTKNGTDITAEDVKASLAGTHSEIQQSTMLILAASKISDFLQSTEATTALGAFTTNLTNIISAIKGNNSSAEIIVVNQYNPYSRLSTGNLLDLSALDSAVQALNTAISSGATAGYTVADVYTAFEEATENPCNASVSLPSINLDFHPNAAGHSLIADTISALLTDEGGSEDPEVSGPIFVGGVELTGSKESPAYATTNDSGAVTKITDGDFVPAENNWNIQWDGATLTLKGAKITTIAETPDDYLPQSAAIYYDEATDLEIVLEEDNTVTGPDVSSGGDSSSYGIHVYAEVTLTISGSGSLAATGGDAPQTSGGESYGIYTWGDAIITSGTVTATGGAAEFQSHGIYATGHVTISGGAVKATGGAVTSSEEDGGDASSGIYANIVTISGGEVTAKGGAVTSSGDNARSCGIYGRNALKDNVIITGGTVEATGGTFTSTSADTEADAGSYGIYGAGLDGTVISGGTVTATGGTFTSAGTTANAESYGIYTPNSYIEISGGTVTATGDTGALGRDVYLDPEGTSIAVTAGQDAENAEPIAGSPFVLTEDITNLVSGAKYFHSESQTLVGDIFVGGVGLTGSEGNPAYAKTGADGAVTTEGANANDYSIKWDGATLTLNNATITQDAWRGAAIWYYRDSDLNIALVGTNTVTGPSGSGSGASDGIFAYGPTELIDLTISGDGSLTVTGGGTVSESYGICTGNLIVQSGTVNATGGDSEEDSYGIYADYVTITGGTVTAEGGTAGEKSAGIDIVALTISGGTVTATGNTSGVYAVYEDGEITVSPQGDQQIAVLLGESETAAAAIAGSPFASEAEITDQVNTFGKYFHSEVVGITPPEPEEFTITFDAAGGTTPASQTTVDGKLTSLPTSTRDGYDFLGWYTAGGDWVTTDTVFTADTTLYARWAEQAGPGDDDKPPYIPPQPTGPNTGNSEGWDDIQEEIGQAQPGDTITIDMNG